MFIPCWSAESHNSNEYAYEPIFIRPGIMFIWVCMDSFHLKTDGSVNKQLKTKLPDRFQIISKNN